MKTIVALGLLALSTVASSQFVQDCTNALDGLYAIGNCESQFLTCSGGIARIMDCPADLIYNEPLLICDWRHNVVGCEGSGEASGEASGEGSGEASGENSGEASGENSGENSGEGSGEFEPTCDGKADGIYPNGVCVPNFLTCSGGIARVMNCPASLIFNPEILVCDWPRDVVECHGVSTPAPVCEDDGYFSFGQCSSSFTACTNGRAIVMFCPAGLKFSQANQRCDYDDLVNECQEASGEESGEASGETSGEQSGEGSGEASGEASGESSGENECVSLDNGLHAIGCSPRVLSCQNGHVDIFECPSSLVFNEQTLICDYPQTSLKCLIEDTLLIDETPMTPFDCSTNGLFSDGLCSSNYHQCSAGQLINFTCAETNAIFSAANAECVDSSTLLQCH